MKQLMIGLSLFVGLGFVSCTQDEHAAPAQVLEAFDAKFPAVEKATWNKQEDGMWEATFMMADLKAFAVFKDDGAWAESGTQLTVGDLPTPVKNEIDSRFAGYALKEVYLVDTPSKNGVYQVELDKGGEAIKAWFNEDGTIFLEDEADTEQMEDQG